MKILKHVTASSSHYDEGAGNYDLLNEENRKTINMQLVEILKQCGVKTVLDLTCGTGSQIFWLVNNGFEVVGVDINTAMLNIAKEKAKSANLDIQFLEGDIRTTHVGEFDAIVTIFNSIGHLTKSDFEKAIQNVSQNLKIGGLYIFDIFNLDFLLSGANIANFTIDWIKEVGNKKVREIQYSTIDQDGILASFTTSIVQEGNDESQAANSEQTIQVYAAEQLKELLQKNGFEVVDQTDVGGSKLDKFATESILTVAKKI